MENPETKENRNLLTFPKEKGYYNVPFFGFFFFFFGYWGGLKNELKHKTITVNYKL